MKSLGIIIAFVFFIAIVLVVCMSSSQHEQRGNSRKEIEHMHHKK